MGSIFKTIRKNKGLTLKELQTKNLSISQLSKIENEENVPSAKKFIEIISLLNLKYEEFILLLDNDYLHAKTITGVKYAEFANSENIDVLQQLSEEALLLFQEYNDMYFQHIFLQAQAILALSNTNNDYAAARIYLDPIKKYFLKVNNWGSYELYLFNNCLFMFDIDDATFFGDKALKIIEKNHEYYQTQPNARALLNNLALFTLDYDEHLFFSLNCAKMCEELSFLAQDSTRTIQAKISKQIVYFKLKNGQFNKEKLQALVQVYQLIEWENTYISMVKFIQKFGISLDS